MFLEELLDLGRDSLFGGDFNRMQTDIVENTDGYLVISNLPGFSKEGIEINFKEGYLTIKAKKNNENKKDLYILKERVNNIYERSFYFGNKINEQSIKAKMENGVLYINLSFKECIKKNITIE